MKLNPDCIRDVLLYLEENLYLNVSNDNSDSIFIIVNLTQIQEALSEKYTNEDIWYSVYNLHKAKYIEGKILTAGKKQMFFCDIEDITWKGHEFLNNVRPQTIWEATKAKASKLGGLSLQALNFVASKTVESVISNPKLIQDIVVEKVQ